MIKILFFSNNQKKINEVLKLFNTDNYKIFSLNDFSNFKEPKEDGITFEENALIKSSYGFKKYKIPCFSDDSGICISALKNKTGIHSKEFLEGDKKKKNIFLKIIAKAKKEKNYKAYFQTSISLSLPENKAVYFQGVLKGSISKEIKGLSGFGYDPIFIPNGYKKTLAEMNINEKNKISHRSIAVRKMKKHLENSSL